MKDNKIDIRKDRELCVYCRFNEEGKCYQPKGICPYVEIVLKYQDIARQAERQELIDRIEKKQFIKTLMYRQWVEFKFKETGK